MLRLQSMEQIQNPSKSSAWRWWGMVQPWHLTPGGKCFFIFLFQRLNKNAEALPKRTNVSHPIVLLGGIGILIVDRTSPSRSFVDVSPYLVKRFSGQKRLCGASCSCSACSTCSSGSPGSWNATPTGSSWSVAAEDTGCWGPWDFCDIKPKQQTSIWKKNLKSWSKTLYILLSGGFTQTIFYKLYLNKIFKTSLDLPYNKN